MYKLKDLKIVKYNTDEYYMCELKDGNYKEIFTNKKLDINNIDEIEELSSYYSINEILSGFYKGTLESLFHKYNIILKYKNLLNYDEKNVQNNIYYADRDRNIKMYSVDKLYYIEFKKYKYRGIYISKYNKLTNEFVEFFTKKEIIDNDNSNITGITPLNNFNFCYNFIDKRSGKISKFNILKIYNELNRLNIINNYTEDDIIEELKNNGVYEESKIYQKRSKVKTITWN